MSDKPENPQAFPIKYTSKHRGAEIVAQDIHLGMTLRDYFAGQALVGTISATFAETWGPEHIAGQCYYLADAMLKEREK